MAFDWRGESNVANAQSGVENWTGFHNQLLTDMIDKGTGAINDELQSRVAQQREERRMAHERQMKQMDIDAMLMRLNAAQKPPSGRAVAFGDGYAIYG